MVLVVFSFFPEKSSNIRRQQKLPPVAVIYKPMTESAVMFKTTNKTQNSKASSYCWKSSFSHQKRFVWDSFLKCLSKCICTTTSKIFYLYALKRFKNGTKIFFQKILSHKIQKHICSIYSVQRSVPT